MYLCNEDITAFLIHTADYLFYLFLNFISSLKYILHKPHAKI